jgi:tetratricopeptide (TPR) repeat protein
MRLFWLAALAVFLFPHASLAQRRSPLRGQLYRQNHGIRGSLRDIETDVPIPGARLELRGLGISMSSQTTEASGDFEFTGLGDGQYEVVAEADGYESTHETVLLQPGQEAYVSIRMRKREAAGGTVSVRTLKLPEKARQAYEKGLLELYQRRKPEKSVPLFQTTVQEAPQFYEADYHMGVAFERLGRIGEAESAYREAIRLSEGRHSPSQFAYASLLSEKHSFVPAETAARKGLETAPDSGRGHYELARALLGEGRVDLAEKETRTVLEKTRQLPQVFLLIAAIHVLHHEMEKAVDSMSQYLQMVPKGPASDEVRRARDNLLKEIENQKAAATLPAAKKSPR